MIQVISKLKSAHRSIQVWFNGVLVSIALGLPYAAETFPMVKDYISGPMYKHIMFILVLGNIFIHFRPTQRIDDRVVK